MERDMADENGDRLPDWTVQARDGFVVLEYWPSEVKPSFAAYPVIAWNSFSGSVIPVTPDWDVNDGIKEAIMYGGRRTAKYALQYPSGRVSVPGQHEWDNLVKWRVSIDGGDGEASAE